MYVYEYGLSNFTEKYKPYGHVTVFNDIYEILTRNDSNNITGYGFYIKVVLNEYDENAATAIVDDKGNYTLIRARVFEEYLKYIDPYEEVGQRIVYNFEYNYGGFEPLRSQDLGEVPIVSYKGEYYALIDVNRGQEAVIIATNKKNRAEGDEIIENDTETIKQIKQDVAKRKKLEPIFRELEEDLIDANVSVVMMISNDGAKLERAFQTVTNLLPNEMVIFVENDDGFNFTGSVFRVRSGSAIAKDSRLPFKLIAKLCKLYNIDISRRKIVELLKDHVTEKNEEAGYFVKAGFELIKLGSSIALGGIAFVFDSLTEGINTLRVDDTNMWKRYNKDGNLNESYDPLLPGYRVIKTLQKLVDDEKNLKRNEIPKSQRKDKEKAQKELKKNINKESLTSLEDGITKSQGDLRDSVDNLQVSSLIKYAKKKLQGVFKFLAEVKALIKKVVKIILNGLEKIFIYCNAFIIGLYNSLIDAVTGILQLVSMICKGVNALIDAGSEILQNPGTYFSLFLELFENAMETIFSFFSIKNVVAFVKFLYEIVKFYIFPKPTKENKEFVEGVIEKAKKKYNAAKKKVSEIDLNLSITYDVLGYGIGYFVGFIISEVVLAIATGGAKTVATALQVTAKGYLSIIKGIGKLPKLVGKGVVKSIKFSFDFVIKFMAYLRNFVTKLPQLLKKLANWFNEVGTIAKNVVDEAFKKLFPSEAIRDKILAAGFKPTKVNAAGDIITFCPIK